MDLKPYYKQVAGLLHKAANEVHAAIVDRQADYARREQGVRGQQKQLKKQERDAEKWLVRGGMDDRMKTLKAAQARSLHDDVRLKDKEVDELKTEATDELKRLHELERSLQNEAQSYENRS